MLEKDITFKNCSDDDLIILIQQGNRIAFETIVERYRGLVYTVALTFLQEMKYPQMYLDDFISVAMEALMFAMKRYIVGSSRFFSFWWAVSYRKLRNYAGYMNDTHLKNSDDSFLDAKRYKLNDSEPISEAETFNPLTDKLIETINMNSDSFTQDEKTYLQLNLIGYSVNQVGQILNWKKGKLYKVRRNALFKLNTVIKSD